MNPMAEVIRYRKLKDKQRAIEGALSSLKMGGNPRVEHAVAKAVLIGSPWLWYGTRLSVLCKSIGCGVYELRLEKE